MVHLLMEPIHVTVAHRRLATTLIFAAWSPARPPPGMSRNVPSRTAEMDTEFDELASELSMTRRDRLASATREGSSRLRQRHQTSSDVTMQGTEQIDVAVNNTEGPPARNGRKVTINEQLRKRRAKGKQIDIKFPQQFGKVCGKHASLFKSEISVIVRSMPLQVKKFRDMQRCHAGTIEAVWRKLKEKFPELSEQDKGPSMKQVESHYNNRRYRLLQAYKKNVARPDHISPEDWQWLIRNLWTDPEFQSNQNSLNREKQEMGSKLGTKSIAQIAYELRDPETGAWPTAMQVWKATYQKADGTWSIPSGDETLVQLCEVSQTHQEQISSAPIPMVEHFAIVLGRKANHSHGVGIRGINRVAEERIRLHEQIESAEQRAEAARARAEAVEQHAEAAEQRAEAMQEQVTTMTQLNEEIREEQ
ncbi:hypothetical protein ACP4OV_013104 [Aristida adscensionis]